MGCPTICLIRNRKVRRENQIGNYALRRLIENADQIVYWFPPQEASPMLRILAVAAVCAWTSSALAETRWWALTFIEGTLISGTCVDAHGYGNSPAETLEAFRLMVSNAEIIDKGDEVDVSMPNDPGLRFFRTLEACQKIAGANLDAAKADKEKLDKYR
jgi:hypothetical protein